jgi:dephospho-CoA kinase
MIVGVTGGIGSGKSTVCKVIEVLGFPVFNADSEAKSIYNNLDFINELKNRWEHVVVDEKVDLKKISAIVFSKPDELAWLNSKIHPYVDFLFKQWQQKQKNTILFKEAAILVESGGYKKCDKIIVVEAPIEERVKRSIRRDNSNSDAILQRIKNQISDEDRKVFSDFIITNHEKLIVPQVLKILEALQNS